MKTSIITPEKTLYEGDVKDAHLIGLDGHFELLENHAPIVSALAKGEIRLIDTSGDEHIFSVNGGLLEKSDDRLTILAQ